MKTLFYVLVDLTKGNDSIDSCTYGSTKFNNDIAGLPVSFAKHNGTDVSEIRMFIFETKKAWQRSWDEWLSKVKNYVTYSEDYILSNARKRGWKLHRDYELPDLIEWVNNGVRHAGEDLDDILDRFEDEPCY